MMKIKIQYILFICIILCTGCNGKINKERNPSSTQKLQEAIPSLVDGVSSATKEKTRTGTLVGGSYHEDPDGTDISGVIFPVLLGNGVTLDGLKEKGYTEVTDSNNVEITTTNKGQTSTTTYKGKDALFEQKSYSYYCLTEKPSYYKEVTINSEGKLTFGDVQGAKSEELQGVTPQFMIASQYGDYQLNLNGMPEYDTIYGVVIETKEGYKYGLRHLENIWRTSQLAWCSGFTTKVHNCDTSSEHYVSMMGKHINQITYYTSEGIFKIPTADIYVPIKFGGYEFSVQDADVTAGSTTVTVKGFPADFAAEYEVVNLADAKVTGDVLSFPATVKPGSYTLKVKDTKGVYADITSDFVLSTDSIPVSYNEKTAALEAAADLSNEDFVNYINNITKVSVNGNDYMASGKGAVKVINEDGKLVQDATPFQTDADSYQIEVTATGYKKNVIFIYKKTDVTALKETIEQAKGLTAADYTTESWQKLQAAISVAETVCANPENQQAVDHALSDLEQAVKTLVKAANTETKGVKKGDTYSINNLVYKVTTVGTGKGTVAVTAPKNKEITSVTIPATVTIQKETYKVTAVSQNAFANCKKLKKVVIGSHVTTIGKNAFKGDSKLKNITIKSKKLKKVGSGACTGIDKSAEIKVPSSKLKEYKKLFKGKGQGNEVTIKK